MKISPIRRKLWSEIGDAFYLPYGRRNGKQMIITSTGLCSAIKYLFTKESFYIFELHILHSSKKYENTLGYWYRTKDIDGIYGGSDSIEYSYGVYRKSDKERATLAYLFSHMTNKDALDFATLKHFKVKAHIL